MTNEETWLLKEKYNSEKTESFFADCARLKDGEPLAYIIGHIPFHGTTIFLDSHPLIPRTETEYWVGEALTEMRNRNAEKGLRVLDLCAGSGCIGVTVLSLIPNAQVDFAEIENIHLETIKKNIVENGITLERTTIIQSDIFSGVDAKYDFILSNPPYIDPEHDRATQSVKTYEPHRALYGGTGGLEIITKILIDAKEYLTQNGVLFIEHEPEQTISIETYAKSLGYTVHSLNDQYGVNRYTRFTRESD